MIYTEEGYNLALDWLLNQEKYLKHCKEDKPGLAQPFWERKKEIQKEFRMTNFPVDQVEKFMKSVVRTYEGW